jgi:hypothetical protein
MPGRPRSIASIAWLAVLASLTAAACGASGTPEPPTAPPTTPAPTQAIATVTPSGFGGAPYDITIPSGWQAFNLADPAAKAGLGAFVEANPALAASVQQFESMPNARMAVNPLLGDFLLVITTPSGGIPLDTLAQSFTAQFQVVPGLEATPAPQNVTLPAGDAIHWEIRLSSNRPDGGTITVEESIYLLASSSDAVVVEFVTPAGGVVPDEQTIINSFRFAS